VESTVYMQLYVSVLHHQLAHPDTDSPHGKINRHGQSVTEEILEVIKGGGTTV